MKQKSGKVLIDNFGKLILTAEIFDKHASFDFNAFIDTGSSFGMVITKDLADAVCAKVESETNISIGGGTSIINGQIRVANFRFGDLILLNYKVIVTTGKRNLVGIKFFQDAHIMMLVDFKGKTQGSLINNNRKLASILGKATHCFTI